MNVPDRKCWWTRPFILDCFIRVAVGTAGSAVIFAGLTALCGAAGALVYGVSLDPVQPVLFSDGILAKDSLAYVGGNGLWYAGEYWRPLLHCVCQILYLI